MARYSEEDSIRIKQRIIDTAIAMIKDSGKADLPIRKLAEQAEVSPTSIYNMFGSKADLLIAVIGHDFIIDIAELGITPSPEDSLFDIINDAAKIIESIGRKEQFGKATLIGIIQNIHELDTSKLLPTVSSLLELQMTGWQAANDLKPDTPIPMVSQHIVQSVLSNILFWATNSIATDDLHNHIAYSLLNGVEPYAQRKFLETVKAELMKRTN